MRAKKKILKSHGLCSDDCKLYFHANKVVGAGRGLIQYPFTETQSYCEPGLLIDLLHGQVSSILNKDTPTIDKVAYSLIALVDQKVLNIHQRYISSKDRKALSEIAKEDYSSIKFHRILDILFAEEEVFVYDRVSYITHIKYKLIKDLLEISNDQDDEELTEEQKKRTLLLVEGLRHLNIDGMESFLKRVHPIESKAQTLFNVISELEPLDEDLSWKTNKGTETPTSLNSDMSVSKLCKKILKNIINQDSLYEYNWLVGDIRENVDNIGSYLPTISDFEGKGRDGRSIFEIKKVGLVTRQNRKDGKY